MTHLTPLLARLVLSWCAKTSAAHRVAAHAAGRRVDDADRDIVMPGGFKMNVRDAAKLKDLLPK